MTLRALVLLAVLSAPAPAGAQQVQAAAGIPGILDDARGAMAMLTLRFDESLLSLQPMAGVLAASRGQLFVFGGVFRDLELGHWVVTPMLSAGAYEKGHGRDLGSRLQFRSALEVARRFPGGRRVGLQVAHLSNAGLGWRNPGQERLLLTFTLPF